MDLKEKILESHLTHDTYYPNGDSSKLAIHEQDCKLCEVNLNNGIEKAMDELSKIVAIAFFKWTESNLDEDGMYNGEMKTDDELFHLFTQSKEYKELMNS